jgi:hypothetical protein
MGINIGSSFSRQAGVPLDDSVVVADTTARDAIVSGIRYEGMTVFSVADSKNYQLVGGIANGNWVEIGGGGGMLVTATQSIAAAGQITPNGAIQQLLKVQGNAGPQTSSTTPFLTPPLDGTIITLLGKHAVNILKIPYADIAEGCMLKGDCYLGLNDSLTLVYDITDQRYWELARN